jgi:RHS repeat-associated protein
MLQRIKQIKNPGIEYFLKPQKVSICAYYAFGSQMPGRLYNSANYRYGFNGKENDNEIKGTGNQQDYGMRIYDPRLGKFLSVDPLAKKFPELSPYQYASNNPILCIDFDGLEGKVAILRMVQGSGSNGQALVDGQIVPAGDVKGSTYQVGNTLQTSATNNNPNTFGAFIRVLNVNVSQGKSTMYNNTVVKVADIPLSVTSQRSNAGTIVNTGISGGDVSGNAMLNSISQSVNGFAQQLLANESLNSINIAIPQQLSGVSGRAMAQFQSRLRTAINVQLQNNGINGVPIVFNQTTTNAQNQNSSINVSFNSTISTFGTANLAQDLGNAGANQQTINNTIQAIQTLNNNANNSGNANIDASPGVKNQNNPNDNQQ